MAALSSHWPRLAPAGKLLQRRPRGARGKGQLGLLALPRVSSQRPGSARGVKGAGVMLGSSWGAGEWKMNGAAAGVKRRGAHQVGERSQRGLAASSIPGHLFATGVDVCLVTGEFFPLFCLSGTCVAAGKRLFLCNGSNFGDRQLLEGWWSQDASEVVLWDGAGTERSELMGAVS